MSDLCDLTVTGTIGNTELAESYFKFSVANHQWDHKDKEEKTVWFNCFIPGRDLEGKTRYVAKGARVTVRGKLEVKKYTDKNGNERESYSIVTFPGDIVVQKFPEPTHHGKPNPEPNKSDLPF